MNTAAEALLLQLRSSLEDVRLSDDERRSLAEALDGGRPGDEIRRRLRNRAFELVRECLVAGDARAIEMVKWLEGVARLLDRGMWRNGKLRAALLSPGTECSLEAIRQHVRNAQRNWTSVHLPCPTIGFSSEILAAHRRGVAVRLITDNDKEMDAGSDIGRLRGCGSVCCRGQNFSAYAP